MYLAWVENHLAWVETHLAWVEAHLTYLAWVETIDLESVHLNC